VLFSGFVKLSLERERPAVGEIEELETKRVKMLLRKALQKK
jgi:hypothetical protein